MAIAWKILIGIGIIIGITLVIALGITAFVFGELKDHGVPFGSYNSNHEYEYSETTAQTIDASGKEILAITNSIGDISIVGWAENFIELQMTKNADSKSAFDQLNIEVLTSDAKRISIVTDRDEDVHGLDKRVDYALKVPNTLEIIIKHGVGELRLNDLKTSRSITVDFGVGDFEMVDVEAADQITLDIGVGDVFIKNLIGPNISIKLGMGNLDINLASGAPYQLSAQVGVGDLSLSGFEFMPGVKLERHGFLSRNADILFGDGSQQLTLEVGMGDLSIEIFEKD